MLLGNHSEPGKINQHGTETNKSTWNRGHKRQQQETSSCAHWLKTKPRISSYLTVDQKLLLINSVIKVTVYLLLPNMGVLFAFFEHVSESYPRNCSNDLWWSCEFILRCGKKNYTSKIT